MNRGQFLDAMHLIVACNMGIFAVVPALVLTPMSLTHPVVMLQVGLILATAVFFFFALKKGVIKLPFGLR